MYCTYGNSTQRQKIFKTGPILTETVYNLVPPPEKKKDKVPRYKSIYSDSVKEFYKSQKSPHKTMGCHKLISPKSYLKKYSAGSKFLEQQQKNRETNVEKTEESVYKKPNVPRHNERPAVIPVTTTKNFIKENIRNATRLVTKRPVAKIVDCRKGHVTILEFSGLIPKYTLKKNYGKIPKYLVVLKQSVQCPKNKYEEYVRAQMNKKPVKQLDSKEKDEILNGLKQNWAEMNRAYASIPLKVDTSGKKMRKEQLEDELKMLEKDIALLEKYDEIYVLE